MTKQEFINTGLCEQYVLKLTSEEENELVEEMLEKYPELKQDCMCLGNRIEKYICAQKKSKNPIFSFFSKFLKTLGLQ